MDCRVCFEPFKEQIYQCINGHSLCSKCSSRLIICPTCAAPFMGTRNFDLEIILAEKRFPCENNESGCLEYKRVKDLRCHEKICDFRKYKCGLCSLWERKDKLIEHVCRTHKLCICFESEQHWSRATNRLNVAFFCTYYLVFGELFELHTLSKENVTYWILYYIGPMENASEYYYDIEINTEPSSCRKWKFSEVCAKDTMTDDEVIESGLCVNVSCATFATFADRCKDINYIVTIKRLLIQ